MCSLHPSGNTPRRKTPGCNEFYNAYIQGYNEKPSYHAATAYAGGQILEAAIKKAGSLDREKIRVILSSMDAISIIGRYGVDKTGAQIKHFNLIIQWQNGKKGCLARGPENSRPDIQMRDGDCHCEGQDSSPVIARLMKRAEAIS